MKKYKYYVGIVLILMIVPMIMKTIKTNHKIFYKKNSYKIKENFYIEEKKYYYEFIIEKGNKQFSFTINNKLNKSKKIIKKIKEYKEGNLFCILPFYRNNISLKLYCRKNNVQVSNDYIKEDENYQKILNKIRKFYIPKEKSKIVTNYKKCKIYQGNLLKDDILYLWNYKGIYIIKNNEIKSKKILNEDIYDNLESIATKRYYVLLDNRSINGIDTIYYYDSYKDKLKTIKLKMKLAKNSYINGIIEKDVYITDPKKKIQYRWTISSNELIEIGNEELQYIKYVNNKKKLLTKSDFFMKKQYFTNERISNKKISASNDCIYQNNNYYFKEDNMFYRQLKSGYKELLFELNDVKEWSVIDRKIIMVKDDSIYLYDDELGLRKILEYNELKYNYHNIYQIGK